MEDIITKARAFIANHAQEPRYGAVDEMVKGLLSVADERAVECDKARAEVRSLHRELAAAESKHTKAVLDGGKVMDALVKRAHEIMTERDEALAMAEAAMREGLSECERLRALLAQRSADMKAQSGSLVELCDESNRQRTIIAGLKAQLQGAESSELGLMSQVKQMREEIGSLRAENLKLTSERDRLKGFFNEANRIMDAVRGVFPPMEELSDSASQGWTPATVCEACKGYEITGCICGMVPGTEPWRWIMEDVTDEKISHMGEVPESFER